MDGRCVIVDLRNVEEIYTGNRFIIYALFPEAYFSVHIAQGIKGQNTPVMIGKSILKNGVDKNIGELCLKYGGGGHKNAGTCQFENDKIDSVLPEILEYLNK